MWKTEKTESVQESAKNLAAFVKPVDMPATISVVDGITNRSSGDTTVKQTRRRKPAKKKDESTATSDAAQVEVPPSRSTDTDAKQRSEILGKNPDYWSEATLYRYFTTVTPLILPDLVEVEEVLLRRMGGVKMKVIFKNTSGELCPVWMSGSLIYDHYKDAYLQAQKYFAQRM